MEEIDYSVLFRWFVGMNLDEPVWDVTVFTKNRDRLLDGDVARAFLSAVIEQAQEKKLTSDEHFTVDGTLLEAWAGAKSFRRKDEKDSVPPDDPGNPTVNFHSERRVHETHESKTDKDALMARKGIRQGSQTQLQRTPLDGKPQRVNRADRAVASQRQSGTRCGLADVGASSRH
jgi:transposase-like protein DUF772